MVSTLNISWTSLHNRESGATNPVFRTWVASDADGCQRIQLLCQLRPLSTLILSSEWVEAVGVGIRRALCGWINHSNFPTTTTLTPPVKRAIQTEEWRIWMLVDVTGDFLGSKVLSDLNSRSGGKGYGTESGNAKFYKAAWVVLTNMGCEWPPSSCDLR